MGQLLIRVYDIALPSQNTTPLAEAYLGDPIEISIHGLPEQRIAGLPETVYVSTSFIDNPDIHSIGYTVGGSWIGGGNYSAGINNTLQPIELALGEATAVVQPLTAVRSLEVTVSVGSSVEPPDNAQGPLEIAGYRTKNPGTTAATSAFGRLACADLSNQKSVLVSGWLIGSGAFWLAASLDDFGLGHFRQGSVSNYDTTLNQLGTEIQVAADQYKITDSIVLGTAMSVSGQPPASTSCP
jgi:hypothetical protein